MTETMTEPAPADGTAVVDVLITLINYKTAEMTIDCARSVLEHAGDVDYRLVIIDNASNDGSVEALEAWIDSLPDGHRIELVCSTVNTGFAGGHNLGIATDWTARHYMPLNSDAVIRPGMIERLLAALEADPGLGLVGPALLNNDGAVEVSAFRFHSPWSEFERAACTGPITRWLDRRRVALPLPPPAGEIDWVSFACVLIRGEVVRDLEALNAGYFLYFDDSDFCVRARRRGWRAGYVPEAVAVHFRGGSAPVKTLDRAKRRLPKYWYASRARMFYTYGGRGHLVAANLAWHLGRAVAQLRWLTGRRPNPMPARQWLDIWTNVLDPTGDNHAPGR